MSLSGALGIAQSALANTSAQTALVSKNIANVSNTNYSRETSTTLTQSTGAVTTGPTQRATDAALLASLLSAQSASTGQESLSDGLTQIASALGLDSTSSTSSTEATDNSPATAIGAFTTALQSYASQPDDNSLATAAVASAKSLATNLNQASASVQAVREQADSAMASSVQTINSLLTQFTSVNNTIVSGTQTGQDVSDAEDTRDGILKQLSQEIGITTVQSSNGSTAIYTDSGATLFETTPRTVSFTPTTTYTAGTTGQAVMVDGVPVTGASSVMPISTGRLAGLATLRDSTTVDYQNQLDQVAAGLITTFGESDQTGGGAPTQPGLFTSSSLSGMPTAATTTGLAATISIAASVDPTVGGNASLLRDGNISSSSNAYTYNTTGAAGYSTRLQSLVSALGQAQSFDPSSGGEASGTLASYATSSVSWLEGQRQTSTDNYNYQSSVVSTATTALSNATGVSLDTEMSNMLDVEHAYQASAQLMNTVNSMFSTLIQAFN